MISLVNIHHFSFETPMQNHHPGSAMPVSRAQEQAFGSQLLIPMMPWMKYTDWWFGTWLKYFAQ
jgi:hypothetical protein